MNKENYISEETFEELVNGLEFIESFTLYGRKSLKYRIKRLQNENQQLKEQLQQKEDIINKIKDCVEEFLCSEYYCSQGLELHDFCVKILEILDNKGE